MAASLPNEAEFGFWPPPLFEAKAGGSFLFFLFPRGATPPAGNCSNRRWAYKDEGEPSSSGYGAKVKANCTTFTGSKAHFSALSQTEADPSTEIIRLIDKRQTWQLTRQDTMGYIV